MVKAYQSQELWQYSEKGKNNIQKIEINLHHVKVFCLQLNDLLDLKKLKHRKGRKPFICSFKDVELDT